MRADTDLEQRLRTGLATLDREHGPHPVWAESPAAAMVATDAGRRRRTTHWRLLAVAAVLVLGGAVAAILVERQPDDTTVGGCPTLADYETATAAASPTPPPGKAPGASFPPVAPGASATTGLLEPGAWAILVDEEGPAYQVRVRDPQVCARLPNLRPSEPGGELLLARADVRILRDGMGWINFDTLLTLGFRGLPAYGYPPDSRFIVPGIVRHSSLSAGSGFAQSSLILFDLPQTRASVSVHLVHPRDGSVIDPTVGWRLRAGDDRPDPEPTPIPTPGTTATTGEIALDAIATVIDPGSQIRGVVTVGDIAEVSAYPQSSPPRGLGYLEARVGSWFWDTDPATDMSFVASPAGSEWLPTDVDGNILPILGDDGAVISDSRSLWPLMPSSPVFGPGWLVIEAPASGPVRLALTLDGEEQWFVWLRR